jgi:DNA-binding LytR/AlgR family response regulator
VFTTATDEKSTIVFKQNKLDYLLKPICADELKKIIEKYRGFDIKNWKPVDVAIFTNR